MDDDQKKAFKSLLTALDAAIGELPKPEGLEDWEYRDIPWMAAPYMGDLIELLGDGNYRFLAMSRRTTQQGVFVRGQMFISPAGLANLVKYTKRRRKVN